MNRTELEHFDARLCKRIQGFIEVPGQRASAFFPRTASQHEHERLPDLAREHRCQLADFDARMKNAPL